MMRWLSHSNIQPPEHSPAAPTLSCPSESTWNRAENLSRCHLDGEGSACDWESGSAADLGGSVGTSLSFSGLHFSQAENDRNHPDEGKCRSDLGRGLGSDLGRKGLGRGQVPTASQGKGKLHGLIVSPPGKWAE